MNDTPGIYSVGKLYSEMRTSWDADKVDFNYRVDQCDLRLFYDNPSREEIQSIQEGEAQFGLVTYRSVVFLLFRFGVMPWSDAGYSWHLVTPEDRTIPEMPTNPDSRGLLQTFLINSSNGILEAMRVCTVSPRFTRMLYSEIIKQSEVEFVGLEQHIRDGQAMYQRYTSSQMVQLAKVRCKGGE